MKESAYVAPAAEVVTRVEQLSFSLRTPTVATTERLMHSLR